jgi:TonB family protein
VIELEPQWQDEVINGLYPLRRRLGGSDHSTVFLTECHAQNAPSAALKIVPIERVTLALLSHWRMVEGLSHPHLIRLFDAGLCQLGGRQYLFVVMEYAEQTLAEVLPSRALTAEEVRELLPPTLDALAFLHSSQLVHARLKPTNLLVVNDQLKLASDTARPAGELMSAVAEASPYDPPEGRAGRLFPAGDIWSLGMTLVEALTQRLPAWSDERSDLAELPSGIPAEFLATVQRCLNRDPAGRPTIAELQTHVIGIPAPVARLAEPAVREAVPEARVPEPVAREEAPEARLRELVVREEALPPNVPPPPPSPKRGPPLAAIGVVIVLLVAILGGLRLFRGSPASHPPVAVTTGSAQQTPGTARSAVQSPQAPGLAPGSAAAPPVNTKSRPSISALPRAVSPPSNQAAEPTTDVTSSSVVHQEIPNAPHSALNTIHGHVKVAVLVIVDRSGNVVDAILRDPGPSQYFARLAKDAARKWKFTPAESAADNQDSRQWLLRFEFTRGGTTAHAIPRS